MMKFISIGIDCGDGGGIAVTWADSIMSTHPTPTHSEGEVCDLLKEVFRVKPKDVPIFVFIERIGGYVAGRKLPGARMFTMGRAFDYPFGVCHALNIGVKLVEPRKWQEWVGIPLGLEYQPRKRRSRDVAFKRYGFADGLGPNTLMKDADCVCDAAHIAMYGRYLVSENKLDEPKPSKTKKRR